MICCFMAVESGFIGILKVLICFNMALVGLKKVF